jgi:hypothetical protein
MHEALAMQFEGLRDVTYGNGERFVYVGAYTGTSKWILAGIIRILSNVEVCSYDF